MKGCKGSENFVHAKKQNVTKNIAHALLME